MANPKFQDLFTGADLYIWEDLPIEEDQPHSTSIDQDYGESVSRDIQGTILEIQSDDESRLVWEFTFSNITENQKRNLLDFFKKGVFKYFPDSALGTNTVVLWTSPEAQAEKLPGGLYVIQGQIVQVFVGTFS